MALRGRSHFPQGSTCIDSTGDICFFNRNTPIRTPVYLLLDWLVRFPHFIAVKGTFLDELVVPSFVIVWPPACLPHSPQS